MIKKKLLLITGIVFLVVVAGFLLINFGKEKTTFLNQESLDGISEEVSLDINDTRPIGYEFLNSTGHVVSASQGDTVHIWNTQDDYFFNKSSGIQFTNHFQNYWTRNIFCIGFYNGTGWNKIYCADELENFNRTISTDNSTYVNATLWKDVSYGSYDLRLGVQYYLGLNDENLSVTIYAKNIGIDIPFDLGFAWKITDWEIPPNVGGDSITINSTRYDLDGTYDLLFENMSRILFEDEPEEEIEYIPFLRGQDFTEFLRLDWNKDLNYKVKMEGDGNQENFYVAVLINAGNLSSNQEKSTTLYWIDAEGDAITNWDTNANGHTAPQGITTNNTLLYVIDKSPDAIGIYFMNGTFTGRSDISLSSGHNDPKGVTMDDTYFYSTDEDDLEVYRMFHNGTASTGFSLAAGNEGPRGIEEYDGFLYVMNNTGNLIYKYYTNGTAQGTISINDGNSGEDWGCATLSGTYIWTTDFGEDIIVKSWFNGTALTTYPAGISNALGMVTNGTWIWIVEPGVDEVYVYQGNDIDGDGVQDNIDKCRQATNLSGDCTEINSEGCCIGGEGDTVFLDIPDVDNLADLLFTNTSSIGIGIQIKWNISSIPPDKLIENTLLCLYQDSSDNPSADVVIWRVNNQSWNEGSSGSDLESHSLTNQESSTFTGVSDNVYNCINVTNQLNVDYGTNVNTSFRLEDVDHPVGTIINTVDDVGLSRGLGGLNQTAYEDKEDTFGTGSFPYINITYSLISEPESCASNVGSTWYVPAGCECYCEGTSVNLNSCTCVEP
jgi:hypothetical protein